MAFFETATSRLAEIDAGYKELKDLVLKHKDGDPELEVWWSHFSCAWDELVQQLGWPQGVQKRGFLIDAARRSVSRLLHTRTPSVFSSPIFGATTSIGMPFHPEFSVVPTAFGFKLCVTGRDMWHPIATGHYSTELSETLITDCLARDTECLVDIGANVGFFSFLYATESSPESLVVACEPSRDNVRLLGAGITENGFGDRVRLLPVAIGEREGQADLHINALGSGGNTLVNVRDSRFRNIMGPATAPFSMHETVAVITLDSVADTHVQGRRALVKIDVEGYEKRVIAGATSWFSDARAPILLYEAWPNSMLSASGANHIEVAQVLEEFGYRIWKVQAPRHGHALVEKWSANRRGQASETGNYLAIPGSLSGLAEHLPNVDTRVFGDTSRLRDLQKFLESCLGAVRARISRESTH